MTKNKVAVFFWRYNPTTLCNGV